MVEEHAQPENYFFELLQGFSFVKASFILEKLDDIKRMQDLPEEAFVTDTRARAVLFVSHRWMSLFHPDITLENESNSKIQLRALKNFMSMLKDIQREHADSSLWGCKAFNTHGRFQAALFYSKLLCCAQHVSIFAPLPETFLNEVVVWYDYMCLPQIRLDGVEDRTPQQLLLFNSCLVRLQDLINSRACHVLSLRWTNDDYSDRLWCVVEEDSVCEAGYRKLRWFIDRDDKVTASDIIFSSALSYTMMLSINFIISDAENGLIFNVGHNHDILESNNSGLLFTCNYGQPSKAGKLFETVNSLLQPLYFKKPYKVDLAKLIYDLTQMVHLYVTDGGDALPAVCIFMVQRYSDVKSGVYHHDLAHLFRKLMKRYLNKESTYILCDVNNKSWTFTDNNTGIRLQIKDENISFVEEANC